VPLAFNLNNTQQAEITEVVTKFKEIYFGGGDPDFFKINDWIQFQSDTTFTFGIDRTLRYHANKSAPVYYYQFSKTGSMNVLKNALALGLVPGSMHTDVFRENLLDIFSSVSEKKLYEDFYPIELFTLFQELFHLFDPEGFPIPYIIDLEAARTRMQVVKMWTNFAKFGYV
jgi:hypothetical protein